MEKRLGFIGILVSSPAETAGPLNAVLTDFSGLIEGRMGRPYREQDCGVVTLIIRATTDELGALTGKLGRLPGISVKSALMPGNPSGPGRPPSATADRLSDPDPTSRE